MLVPLRCQRMPGTVILVDLQHEESFLRVKPRGTEIGVQGSKGHFSGLDSPAST